MKDYLRYKPCDEEAVNTWLADNKIPPQFQNAQFPYHLIALCLNSPGLLDAYAVLGRYISSNLTISPRLRELLIIRCAVKTHSAYELKHHVPIAISAGLTEGELVILQAQSPHGMTSLEMALIQACDELLTNTEISDETFRELSSHFTTGEIMEIISVVGVYNWTAMWLRSFKVTVEKTLQG